jgi:hypothetical protein
MNLDAIEPGPMILGDKPVEVAFLGDTELTITWTKEDGDQYTTTLGWATPELRESNWRNAVKLWADRNLGEYLREVGQGQRTRLLGHGWYFAVLSGPPTWWLPRVKAARWRLMVGWLRRGYVLSRRAH